MSGNTIVDEEFLKSAFNKLWRHVCNFHTLLRVVEDALEQKTMSIQTRIALADHFLDRYFQQATARQIMEIACNLETEETVSPLEKNLSQLKK